MLPENDLDSIGIVPNQHFQEITDAEEKRAIFDALDQGLCIVEVKFDAHGKATDYVFLEVNRSFERQTGMKDAVGKSMRALAPKHEDRWFETYGEIARTGQTKRFIAEAAALARWYDVCAFRVGAPGGNKVAILFDDITERKQQEEHYALLNREIDHRARNMLTLLGALIRLTDGDTVEQYKRSLLGRLDALARSQKVLSDGGADFASYGELVESELAPYHVENAPRVRCSGPQVQLTKPAMQCLAMAMHELATNAVKYGALSVPQGAVSIAWSLAGGWLHTEWKESGGPPVVAPAQQGVGTSVILRCVRDQLGGKVAFDWRGEGLRCALDVPVETGATARPN